jgi:tyrosinase-like protein
MKLNTVTRRRAILGAAGSIAATAIPGTVRAEGTSAKRKNIDALSAPELDAYKHAIQIVKNRSAANPDDPTGYAFWASLHDNFDETKHSGCAHFSEKFFPWHRRYLSDFELVLQQTDPPVTAGVMIPYWDWSQPPAGGGHFPQPFLDTASPLFDRRILAKTPPPWDPADILNLVKETDWNVFAGKPDPSDGFGNHIGAVEVGPHNTLHGNISRDMANPETAVNDPIFWSFHAGIDLVWARWQRLHVADGSSQTFSDPTAIIWFRDRSYTVASTAKTTDFRYVYDYDFSGDGPPAGPALLAQAPTPGITSPPRRTLALTPVASGHDITAQVSAPSPLSNSTLLRLAGVKVFHDKTYRLVLYLHPNDANLASLSPQSLDQYRMRVLTLWRGHHDGEVELFVRPTAAQLTQLNQGWTVTVQSEAVPDEGGSPSPMSMGAPSGPLPATPELLKTLELQER